MVSTAFHPISLYSIPVVTRMNVSNFVLLIIYLFLVTIIRYQIKKKAEKIYDSFNIKIF